MCAFSDCTGLKTIVFRSKSINFNVAVFDGCTSLESVIIYGNITKITWSTFDGCTSLASFVYYGSRVPTDVCSGIFRETPLLEVVNVTMRYKSDLFCEFPVTLFQLSPSPLFSESLPFSSSNIYSCSSEFTTSSSFTSSKYFSPSSTFTSSKYF